MSRRKIEENTSGEIITPISLEDVQERRKNIITMEASQNYVSSDIILERNDIMINATNPITQTIQPSANVIFTGSNVRTNSCSSCCGWLNHDNNSGIFTITKAGIYKVHFNANLAPTVAGAITLNIANSGESIAGGEMKTTGTTVGTFENVAAEILIRVPCNSSVVITIKNNTATNPITVSQPSLTIDKLA